jgi:hypothetical protein
VFKNGLCALQKQIKASQGKCFAEKAPINTIYDGEPSHCAGQEKEIAVV